MMDDLISRQAAIDAVEFECGEWIGLARTIAKAIKQLPSAEPTYTDTEIQKMQDLESAEIEKAYQIGYEEGKKDAQPDLPIKEKCAYCPHCENCDVNDDLSIAQPELQNARIFQEIVVEYPSYNTYPEYEGKPYFSIKYTEDGQDFIGYGTYKPEVLSQYLKEYFMPSAQPEQKKGEWIAIKNRKGTTVALRCSSCGNSPKKGILSDFCPNCGADMKGKQDGCNS